MTFIQRIIFFIDNIFVQKKLREHKYFKISVILITMFFLIFSISFKNNRKATEFLTFRNVFGGSFFKSDKISEIWDSESKEQTFIQLKAMFIGIIISVAYFSSKIGIIGISIGTFLGSCFGIWLCMGFPSFFYSLELISRNLLLWT